MYIFNNHNNNNNNNNKNKNKNKNKSGFEQFGNCEPAQKLNSGTLTHTYTVCHRRSPACREESFHSLPCVS